MKVGLIFPRYKYPSGDPPLGICYLASALREKTDAKIKLIDTTFHKDTKEVKKILRYENFDLIILSVMTTMINDAIMIAKFAKKTNKKIKIIFGGPHTTVLPMSTIKNDCVDAISIGEGEETIVEVVKNNCEFKNIDGIWYIDKKGKLVKNKPRQPMNNLDKLPFPAMDMLNMNLYFQNWFQLDSVSQNLRGINIITSRGCPFKCTFCQPTLFRIFGKKIRKRSPKNIISELKYWKKKYNINAIMFQDDTFVLDKKWIEEICDRLISENMGLTWGCNARANLVNYDLFKKMRKAGLRKVFMGIESGSQRILDNIYDKGITLDKVVYATKILKKLGLKIQGYFMIGAPTETEEEIKKTIKFAKKLPIDEATFSITTPLPGTYLYEKTKEKIVKDVNEFDYYKTSVYRGSGKLNPKRLDYLKKKALLSFYLSPKHILNTMKGFITFNSIKKSFMKLKRF